MLLTAGGCQVEPVEGGLDTNDYAYVRDPINQFDLNGEGGWHCDSSWSKQRCAAELKKAKAIRDGVASKCATGVKGAAEFLGWRFGFSAIDKLFQTRYRDAVGALSGGWGTASTAGAERTGKWLLTPAGRHSAAPAGVVKVLGETGTALGKVAGFWAGAAATIVDYSC